MDIEKRKYIINIPTYFRTNEWAENESISNFYSFFSNPANIMNIDIVVDFKECRWIDPLPIMSLLTFVAQNILPQTKNISFVFPKPQPKLAFDDKKLAQNRVLRFLYTEGFINIINNILEISTNLTLDDIDSINNLNITLNYFDCHLCEVKLIDTEKTKKEDIDNIVNDSIKKIEVNLQKRKLSQFIINSITYKTRVFLLETIDNVKKHAYDAEKSMKYSMIYARYRYGSKSSIINSSQKITLSNLICSEQKNHPSLLRLSEDFYNDKEGFLEVFVVDVGKGIAEALGLRTPDNKWPTHKAFKNVITMDRDCPGSTYIGGLNLIGRILNNDFILSKDREEWLGCTLPLSKTSKYHSAIMPSKPNHFHVRGCYWFARISWNYECKIDTEVWRKIDQDSILPIYKGDYNTVKEVINQYITIDERFNPFLADWNTRNNFYKKALSKKVDKILYYAPENVQKHTVFEHILRTLIGNISSEKELFLVDINETETETYTSAIAKASLNNIDKIFLSKIHLITKSLYYCTLIYDREQNKYIVDNGIITDFYPIFKAVITYDSYIIWKEVDELKKYYTFVNSKIIWDKSTKKNINGYLDFNQLCTVAKFTQLFDIALRRFIGIKGDIDNTDIIGLDPLVKNIVHNFKSKIPPCNNEPNLTLKIGSAIVEGHIQNESISEGEILHCFLHPDSDKKDSYRLFIWPQQDWINKFYKPLSNCYERLGRTHAIAPNGWKYYKIPRYDKYGNSLYFRNPHSSYLDWQSENVGMRIGNYEYDGYYELFKLDIKYVIDAAFLYHTNLAVYLFANFFVALGGTQEDEIKDPVMRSKSWNIIKQILKENSTFYNDVVLIAYPNHYYTNIIIEKLEHLLDQDFYNKINSQMKFIDKIIPLNFIRSSNSNSSGLIAPLTFNKISQLLDSKEGKKNILLFDDAIVNGRTRKEIKHLLLNVFDGVNEVKTLSVIDRFRLPYDIPNSLTHKSYWRLDLPRLGNKKYNPINNALHKVKEKISNFTETAQEVFKRWENGWKSRNPFQDDTSHGLIAEQLFLKKPHKKFGIKYDNERSDFIQIGNSGDANDLTNYIKIENSIGASIYAIETYCLTGRDDIAYNFAQRDKEEVSNKAKIQILCSFLLLFESELRYSIKKLMLDKLIEILQETLTNDNETALASITLINQSDDVIQSVFETACKHNKKFSEDLIVAFVIALPPEIIVKNQFLNRVLIDNSLNKEWNDRKNFHRELYEQGSAHINIFRSFIEKRENACSPTDLIFCLENIIEICKNFNPHILQNFEKETLVNLLNECRMYIKQEQEKNADRTINDKALYDKLEDIDSHLLRIHANIFYQLSFKNIKDCPEITNDNFFITRLQTTLERNVEYWKKLESRSGCKFETSPIINRTNKFTDVIRELNIPTQSLWIPFDKTIKEHLINIFSNVRHGTMRKIDSPFESSIQTQAHLWYNIVLDLENYKLYLIFVNEVDNNDIHNVVSSANNSISSDKIFCDKIGCKTEYFSYHGFSEKEIDKFNIKHDCSGKNLIFCKLELIILK